MAGFGYGDHAPTEICPYCGARCDADFVDVGVGFTQCGPYYCTQCESSEIGPHDKPRELTEIENETGWYAPKSGFGSSANVIGGKLVSHRVMRATYRDKFMDNPEWHVPGAVDEWREQIREPKNGIVD